MSEKSHSSHVPKRIDTLIGAGMRIEGDINCKGVLRLQGEIAGNVFCLGDSGATLIVDAQGTVTGQIEAEHADVRGRVLGPVRSLETIEVHPTGAIVGDISFRRMAIHAGGVVDGQVTAMPATDAGAIAAARAPAATADEKASAARPGASSMPRIALVAVIILVVGAGAWLRYNPEILNRDAGDAAPRAEAQSAAQPQPTDTLASAPKTAESAPQPPAPTSAPPTPEVPAGDEKVAVVHGMNPSRPAGVFLLISNDPSVLYRKKRGEPGDGARVSVPAGEKVSVSVAPDELIRVAQGRDVVIFFQGKKVAPDIIASGAWISFVPR